MSVVVDEKRYDTALLLACAVLLFIGLTTLFSLGLAKSGNWFYKQFFYALLAIILFIGASRLSVSQWKQAAPLFGHRRDCVVAFHFAVWRFA